MQGDVTTLLIAWSAVSPLILLDSPGIQTSRLGGSVPGADVSWSRSVTSRVFWAAFLY